MHPQRPLHTLKIILYVLAVLLFVLGLIFGVSLLASASNVRNVLLPFQLMGADAIANLVAPYLTDLVSGQGVFTLIASFVLSLLLFAVGRLLGYIATLETRLVRLEALPEPSR